MYIRTYCTYTHIHARTHTHACIGSNMCHVVISTVTRACIRLQNAALMGKVPAETIKAEEIYSCLGIHSDYMDFLDREFTKEKKYERNA